MYSRNDPRLRQRLNEISQTIESANESAQANIFTFSQLYITPCVTAITDCVEPCLQACNSHRDRRGRQRPRRYHQGRAELNFDFYDDWDDEENDTPLGWSSHEQDGLLGGAGIRGPGPVSGSTTYGTNIVQPGRQRPINYGTHRDSESRRKSTVHLYDGNQESTVIPRPSYFGLVGRLTSKLVGSKKLRYQPSAADLQDHPGARSKLDTISDASERLISSGRGGRKRSATTGSRDTTSSLSSRGDIFPSDDEDDAVPLDDEFAMVLERRTTNSAKDDASSGHGPQHAPRPSAASQNSIRSQHSMRTTSTRSGGMSRQSSRQTLSIVPSPTSDSGPSRSSGPASPGSVAHDHEVSHSSSPAGQTSRHSIASSPSTLDTQDKDVNEFTDSWKSANDNA